MQQSLDWDKDYAVATPRPAGGNALGLAEGDRRPAGNIYFLQSRRARKCDLPSVRRPEGEVHGARNGERRSSRCTQGTNEKLVVDRKSTRLNSSHLGISY